MVASPAEWNLYCPHQLLSVTGVHDMGMHGLSCHSLHTGEAGSHRFAAIYIMRIELSIICIKMGNNVL